MKHIGFLLAMIFMCLIANAQMVGGFQQGKDGHIYFVANNKTGETFNIRIVAVSIDRNNSEVKTMTPNGGFFLGPVTPWKWYWKKEIKFLWYILMDSHRLGFALKVTMLTIAQVYRSEEVIVLVR